jgi:hypothetical protein
MMVRARITSRNWTGAEAGFETGAGVGAALVGVADGAATRVEVELGAGARVWVGVLAGAAWVAVT